MRAGPIRLLTELWLPIVLVALWWLLSAGSTSLFFPPLSEIVTALQTTWFDAGQLRGHLVPSLVNLGVGLLIAVTTGIVAGVALGASLRAYDAIRPVLEFLRAVPGVALLPLGLVLFGIGARFHIAIIVYGSIWPVLLNAVDGTRSIDPEILDVGRAYRLDRFRRWVFVMLPASSPQIVAGIRTALSIGITVMVFSELVGATRGIGFTILQAQRSFRVDDMWAGMLLLGALGYLLNVAFRGFEHLLLGWHKGMQRGQGR